MSFSSMNAAIEASDYECSSSSFDKHFLRMKLCNTDQKFFRLFPALELTHLLFDLQSVPSTGKYLLAGFNGFVPAILATSASPHS